MAARLQHPNVLRVYGATTKRQQHHSYAIVLERMEGTLASVIFGRRPPDAGRRLQLSRDVVAGVQYLHSTSPAVIHRDIQPRNVLLDGQGVAKLADFGSAQWGVVGAGGTAGGYGPPESLSGGVGGGSELHPAVDIFAVGITLLELWTGRRAWLT